jgi:hypothetical protein
VSQLPTPTPALRLPATPTALLATDPAARLGDREDRIAARRAFVELKQLFMRAVADLPGRKAHWLRAQVRQAHEPLDLWLLRGPVLAALRDDDPLTRGLRGELYRSLDSTFQDTTTLDALGTLPRV